MGREAVGPVHRREPSASKRRGSPVVPCLIGSILHYKHIVNHDRVSNNSNAVPDTLHEITESYSVKSVTE